VTDDRQDLPWRLLGGDEDLPRRFGGLGCHFPAVQQLAQQENTGKSQFVLEANQHFV